MRFFGCFAILSIGAVMFLALYFGYIKTSDYVVVQEAADSSQYWILRDVPSPSNRYGVVDFNVDGKRIELSGGTTVSEINSLDDACVISKFNLEDATRMNPDS